MSGIEDRVLALGGMLQALAQVRRIADTGQSESTPVQVALDSVFRIDALDAEAVYGDAASLRTGLRLLREYLANSNRDEALGKLGLLLEHLPEARLARGFSGGGSLAVVPDGVGDDADQRQQ